MIFPVLVEADVWFASPGPSRRRATGPGASSLKASCPCSGGWCTGPLSASPGGLDPDPPSPAGSGAALTLCCCSQAAAALHAVVRSLRRVLHHREDQDGAHRERHLLRHLPADLRLAAHLRGGSSRLASVPPVLVRRAVLARVTAWF